MTSQPQRVLEFLADLADSDTQRKEYRVNVDTFRWMPLSYTKLFRGETGRRGDSGPMQDGFPDDKVTQRILKTARLHEDEGLLRVGWMWVAGHDPELGPVFCPLASMPVQTPPHHGVSNTLSRALRAGYKFADVVPASELEVTELVEDPASRDRLSVIPHGDSMFATMASPFVKSLTQRDGPGPRQQAADLRKWAAAAAAAAGFDASRVIGAEHAPDHYLSASGLSIVLGLGLYVAEPERKSQRITTAATLRSWAELDVRGSAFEYLYAEGEPEATHAGFDDAAADGVSTSILLNPAQERVVAATGRQRLTVVSGPPGTGKSQTVVATAFDQVRAGRTVLVAAPTDAAVSALVALLEAAPGPDPVVFGASMKRVDVANRLAEGGGPWFDDAAVERTREVSDGATRELARRREQIISLLRAEESARVDPSAVLVARQDAPGLFDTGVDLHAMHDLAARAGAEGGWITRRRARKAWARLQSATRCDRALPVDALAQLLAAATARQHAAALEASGGLHLGSSWDQLISDADTARRRAGEALQAATHHDDRADRSSRRAIGAVAAALRAGRAKRRAALSEVRGRQLTDALPLWVATLRDVDDLLPMQTDLFDVVIIDEASHVDQIGAAPALLRARSALIVGDPRQLRHVSFLAEDRVLGALDRNELAGSAVAAQLDIRRQTLFDAAAAVAPVVILNEHYRSAPHLIAFSAERFYDGRLHIATRHPRNEAEDRIDVVATQGRRDANGVNSGEVKEIMKRLRVELRMGATSVGVLSPFRAQADAIEEAVLEMFDLSEIDALDLRVGTVHSFQGCQRDVVYISLAIDDDSPRGSRSFLSEATLFNVMVTRAKERIHVVSSMTTPGSGVLADYLRHAGDPRATRQVSGGLARWPSLVSAELRLAGLPMVSGYASGRHEVDIVLREGDDAIAVICGVHIDGPEAHIDRHIDLTRAGWTIFEAFESRWGERLQELAVELGTDAVRQ